MTVALWCAAAVYCLTVAVNMTPFLQLHNPLSHPSVVTVGASWAALPATAAVLALPICAARRHPVAVLAALLAQAVLAAWVGWPPLGPFIAADVLAFFIVATGSRRAMLTAAALAPVAWVGTALGLLAPQRDQTLTDQSRMIDLVLVNIVAWAFGLVVRQRLAYGTRLRTQATEQAVTEERLRIARELHDMVAHSIGIIAIQAGAARRCIKTRPEGVQNSLTVIENTSRETLAGLRRMLGALRQADGADSAAPGLADLEQLAEHAAGAGVRVELDWRGEPGPLTPEVDLSAFRIVQEAVTNVVRHAGVDSCRVSIEHRRDAVAIEVLDDGRGGHEHRPDTWLREAGFHGSGGYGLIGMRERVGLLHGEFSAGPRPEGGFRVAARIPVPAVAR